MKLYFVGAAHEVTGSCTVLYACGKKILIDCGMVQGDNIYENVDIPEPLNDIDALFLTHSHIDHSGMIPYIVKNGFSSPIYATSAAKRLCDIMLRDSAHIQEFEARWKNRKNKRSGGDYVEPMYTSEDAKNAIKYFVPCEYDTPVEVFDNISIRFIDAGHLLGSSSIEITVKEDGIEKIILFSGDLGNIQRPLIKDPSFPKKADYLIIESTYGDRLHGERPDYVSQLVEILQSTFDNGGNVVIPSFAVGRTQELLYLIREIKEKNLIKNHPDFPVWVDSPLSVEATEIYDDVNLRDYFDEDTLALIDSGINPIKFKNLNLAITSDESVRINMDKSPKVILSASGMCEAGRIRHHLKHNLWRDECTILFVGYQAVGTLGRKIVDGAPSVKLFGEEIKINANIEQMQGISGHADRNMLLNWIGQMEQKPKVTFVNHGHDRVTDDFAKTIDQTFEISALAPYSGDGFELGDTVVQVDIGSRKLIDKKAFKKQRNNVVYDRLVYAGENLQTVIRQCQGIPNKDMARFADQLDALIEKYKVK